jgi:hypothetical protein
MTPCPECERNKFRAAMWRAEAYKQAGHDKIERPWVGLTEIEICDIEADELTSASSETFSFARAIEAKLKEKNG